MVDYVLRKIAYKEAAAFLSNNKCSCPESYIQYGLFNDNKLVQVAMFGKPTKDKNFQWEIVSNYSIEQDYFKYIWNLFINEHKVRSCVSYLRGLNYEELGFKLVDGYYSYFPFSILYRIDDLTDNTFYIGETTNADEWENGYLGSGGIWTRHRKAHPEHIYQRTVIEEGFSTPRALYEAEEKEIRKYSTCLDQEQDIWKVTDPKCKNFKTTGQHSGYNGYDVCPECGSAHSHKKDCSRRDLSNTCPYCGTPAGGKHKKDCPNFKAIVCPECGGRSHMHKKGCSKYKEKEPCPECGSTGVAHKKTCSRYRKPKGCPECGVVSGHKATCSRYKFDYICEECGGKGGKHKSSCSKSKKCPECGSSPSHHLKTCSRYVPKISKKICPECGAKRGHRPTCSKFKPSVVCPECGLKRGHHKSTCSHYKQKNKE